MSFVKKMNSLYLSYLIAVKEIFDVKTSADELGGIELVKTACDGLGEYFKA